MGTWKLRRLLVWVLVFIALGVLLYSNVLYTEESSTLQGLENQGQRALHSVDHEDGKREFKLTDEKGKVSFVTGNAIDETKTASNNVDNSSTNNEKSSFKENVTTSEKRVEAIKEEFSKKVENILNKRVNPQNKTIKQILFAGNAAAAWNGGAFRYNPYGEPVYNHGNRANYIPIERVVHLDLKGAPPLPSAYKVLVPWLAKYGATSILMEYEDMFPWEGKLAPLAAKNHYTKEDIQDILTLCKENKIEVIPLVQTFGHLEFVLKLPGFSGLREVPRLPQALCPSQIDSHELVKSMIDQMMKLHPNAKYLHIGCDEVYHMGECEKCRLKSKENLFLDHVSKTAKHVKSKYNVIPIIWHDMLGHISESAMKEYNFGELVEPMVWVYAEDVYRFVKPTTWTRFAQIFPFVWGASAFKGAFGEQSTVPNVRRHLDNNMNWLDVMASEGSKFSGGFRGLVLTGWQRHDHFAVLCELLPSALPSLAVNLLATSYGFFNESIYPKLYEAMKCMQTPKYQTGLNLDTDPYLWDKFSWCFFPGALVFKSTARLDAAKKDVRSFIDHVTLSRAWITSYNRRHNFSSPMRIDADLEELPSRLHTLTLLIKTVKDALSEWFDVWTTGEWIEQHIWPLMNELEILKRESESMKLVNTWPARPLPLLPQLEPYGITELSKQNVVKMENDVQNSSGKDAKKRPERRSHKK